MRSNQKIVYLTCYQVSRDSLVSHLIQIENFIVISISFQQNYRTMIVFKIYQSMWVPTTKVIHLYMITTITHSCTFL